MQKEKELAYYKVLLKLGEKQRIQKPFWRTTLFGVKLELRALPKYLTQGEKVYCITPCRYRGRKALAVVTDIRVLVLNRGLLGDFGLTQREEVYFHQIAGGNPEGGIFSSYTLSIPGSGNDFKIDDLWMRDARTFDKAFNKARRDYETKKSTPETKKETHKTDKIKEVEQSNNESELKKKIIALTELLKNDSINKDEYIELVEDVIN
ncbi:MAG: hypothetical protein HXM94_00245 [Parvimonas micra]|uniref:YokE-like PH domain-containing protein n=1 Tax=Parvimonas micra TaxID=33033 RepID=A0A930H2Z5_9FIRM|nr:hypothetical protein [Parvimonas micra]MBF1306217.1 hypothetical protein [Parvimonas micra]